MESYAVGIKLTFVGVPDIRAFVCELCTAITTPGERYPTLEQSLVSSLGVGKTVNYRLRCFRYHLIGVITRG